MTTIIGVKLTDRYTSSTKFQEILTEFGCFIKTRLGLHKTDSDICYPYGIILLEVIDDAKAKELLNRLVEIDGIELQQMVFN